MPNIKPISEPKIRGDVQSDAAVGASVFLTKYGHVRDGALDIDEYGEYEKMLARRGLKVDLDEGRRSGDDSGWISASDARAHFEERYRV